jgi:inner membrane protein
MRFPLLLRGAAIAAVAVAILVPIKLIEFKVAERRARAAGVLQQFAAETSGPQVIAGPFLAIACEETYVHEREIKRDGKAETIAEKKVRACPTAYVTPRNLKVTASMPVDERHRGIYRIRLYRAKVQVTGEIAWPDPPRADPNTTRTYRQAQLVTMVSDARGIRELRAAPAAVEGRAGPVDARFAIRSDLGDYAPARAGEVLPFDLSLELVGTSSLGIAPVGDTTRIELTSDWPHPSFTGGWSPDERRISAQGFDASWRVSRHATGGQAAWEREVHEGRLFSAGSAAGVSLFEPVNVYSLSYRATEYGFLFVLFTFAALALCEATAGIRIHPMQYLLVGSAIAVFFLLLMAASEHIPFGVAYAASAAACVTLLTFYLRHPLGTARRAAMFLGLFGAMYGTLYVLLKSEDHAMLMGSLLVFALLAVAMVATRRVDWGTIGRRAAA